MTNVHSEIAHLYIKKSHYLRLLPQAALRSRLCGRANGQPAEEADQGKGKAPSCRLQVRVRWPFALMPPPRHRAAPPPPVSSCCGRRADFASDNSSGASQAILAAIVAANEGPAPAYGADPWTAKAILEVWVSVGLSNSPRFLTISNSTARSYKSRTLA